MPLKTYCDNCGRGVAGIFSSLRKKEGLYLCPTCYKDDLATMKRAEPPVISSQLPRAAYATVNPKRGGGFMRFLGWCFIIFVVCPIGFTIFLTVLKVSPQRPKAISTIDTTSATQATESRNAPASSEPQLLLLNWTWSQRHSHAIVEGQVKNISSERLKTVEALVEFYTADSKFISSDKSFIEYTTLLPGQTSPFKVFAKWNPEMSSARIDFKTIFGSKINWKKEE